MSENSRKKNMILRRKEGRGGKKSWRLENIVCVKEREKREKELKKGRCEREIFVNAVV